MASAIPIGEPRMVDNHNELGERRDIKEEADDELFAAEYAKVKAERQAAGKADSPIVVCAETMKRLREKQHD